MLVKLEILQEVLPRIAELFEARNPSNPAVDFLKLMVVVANMENLKEVLKK